MRRGGLSGRVALLLAVLGCGDDLGRGRDAGPCRAEDCAPYACGPADSCLHSCRTADECAAEHVCSGGACVGTECTEATALEVCGPYACLAGDCAADCAVGPCADGYYCRGNDNECVPHCTEPDDPLCEGYLCNVEYGECEPFCDDQLPCADGYQCDRNNQCHPLGRIPALDDGEVLIDSGAILDHLDEQVGPERALLPARGPERRRALRLIALATGTLEKVGSIVYERTLRPPERRHAPWLERCRVQAESGLDALEAATGDGWYFGDDLCQPDITVACVVAYLPLRAPELFPPGRHPRLARHLAAAEALRPFAITRPAEDEVMPDGL